jgi:hypothetical protein
VRDATDIFQARNNTPTNIIRVSHNGTQLSFFVNGVANPQTVNVVNNRYYSIELAWSAAAGTGALTGTVTGASGAATTAAVAGTINFANLSNNADRIEDIRLGLITGTPTVTTAPFFDEFDSRRTQNPGRLCRGDAGGGAAGAPDGIIGAADRVLITNEILGSGTQPRGQPDPSEDGLVAAADRVAVTNMILAAVTCN